jgi:hypothetical protein
MYMHVYVLSGLDRDYLAVFFIPAGSHAQVLVSDLHRMIMIILIGDPREPIYPPDSTRVYVRMHVYARAFSNPREPTYSPDPITEYVVFVCFLHRHSDKHAPQNGDVGSSGA